MSWLLIEVPLALLSALFTPAPTVHALLILDYRKYSFTSSASSGKIKHSENSNRFVHVHGHKYFLVTVSTALKVLYFNREHI